MLNCILVILEIIICEDCLQISVGGSLAFVLERNILLFVTAILDQAKF